jgi:hypothetical protein
MSSARIGLLYIVGYDANNLLCIQQENSIYLNHLLQNNSLVSNKITAYEYATKSGAYSAVNASLEWPTKNWRMAACSGTATVQLSHYMRTKWSGLFGGDLIQIFKP